MAVEDSIAEFGGGRRITGRALEDDMIFSKSIANSLSPIPISSKLVNASIGSPVCSRPYSTLGSTKGSAVGSSTRAGFEKGTTIGSEGKKVCQGSQGPIRLERSS